MKQLLSMTALGLALAMGTAHAADSASAAAAAASAPAAALTPQQVKMKTCNAQAKGKKGDERRAFMKGCLSNKPAAAPAAATPAAAAPAAAASQAAAPQTQRDKMKVCSAEAKGKKGDERKAFMSECLKK